jgi:phosphohistidine swiveling domain-containing protein
MWIRSLDGVDGDLGGDSGRDLGSDLGGDSGSSPVDARCGAKAHGLARLLEAKLPVPEGFVLTDEAFRAVVGEANLTTDIDHLGHALEQLAAAIEASEPPAELAAAVAERVQRLGRLAVRSSISLEDRGAGAAAGVFSSRLAVAPEDVWPAIRAVWASVCTPLAAAYARHRQQRDRPGVVAHHPLTVAVIVQRYVPGQRFTVYTRPPGQPSSSIAWVERGAVLRKLERGEAGSSMASSSNAALALDPAPAVDPALALALRAERALGLTQGGADVELIERADGQLFVVQARPIVHPPLTSKLPAPPVVVAALVADGRRWTADLAHNPDPLSPAQAGLIERIERENASPYSLRLCAGYLYSTPRALRQVSPPLSVDELQRRFAAVEVRVATALGDPTPRDLPATLEAFLRFYQVWAFEMSPLVAAARLAAVAQANADGPVPPQPARAGSRRSAVDAMVMACARGELGERELFERIGDLAPAWDVAVPTLAETPQWIATALARARARLAEAAEAAGSPPSPPPPLELTLGDLAFELAELDDVWFAHAQARVRRALLARGEDLAIGADVFWIPLDDVIAAVIDPEAARSRASAARAAHRRASAWRMPPVVGGVVAQAPRWRGVGCGGVVSGRVVHIHNLWELPVLPLGAIAVTPAVTPALAVALVGAAAIVSETGGLLDHGAAMARELGIPCVVGCTDAMSLPVHALVTVDGDAGSVTALETSEPVAL